MAKLVFQAFNLDHEEFISFKNFMIVLSITARGSIEEKLSWAFDMYDFNNEGRLSRKQLDDVFTVK